MSPFHAFQPLLSNNKVLEPNGRFNVSPWSFNCLSATCLLTSVRRWVVRWVVREYKGRYWYSFNKSHKNPPKTVPEIPSIIINLKIHRIIINK